MSHTGWSYATSLTWLRIFLIFATQENLMPSCIMYKHSFAFVTGSYVCMSKKQTTLEPNLYLLRSGSLHPALMVIELDPKPKLFTANKFDSVNIFLILSRFVLNWYIGMKGCRMSSATSRYHTQAIRRWTLTSVIYWINDNMSKDCNQVFSRIDYIYPQSPYLLITSTRWGAGRCALWFWCYNM